MSVRTTADDRRNEAKELIEKSIENLQEASMKIQSALDKETWGSDQWNSIYTTTLEESELQIAKIKLEIKRLCNKL